MRRKLLLADDSITMQRLVSLTFADEAIDVIATGDGDSVLKKVQELRPDIVLVDVFLPGKNGYEICEHIKSSPQLKSIPVILLVGTFEPLDEAEAQRVKADGHLMKPFESSVLVNLVKDLVGLAPAETKSEERRAKGEERRAKRGRLSMSLSLGGHRRRLCRSPNLPSRKARVWQRALPKRPCRDTTRYPSLIHNRWADCWNWNLTSRARSMTARAVVL